MPQPSMLAYDEALESLEYYEAVTFRNMVDFYRDEISQLLNGAIAKYMLTKCERNLLRRLGILKLIATGSTSRRLIVSKRAHKLLSLLTPADDVNTRAYVEI